MKLPTYYCTDPELRKILIPHVLAMKKADIFDNDFKANILSFSKTNGATDYSTKVVTGVTRYNQPKYLAWKGGYGSYSKKEFGDYIPPSFYITLLVYAWNVNVVFDIYSDLMTLIEKDPSLKTWHLINNSRLAALKENNINQKMSVKLLISETGNRFVFSPDLQKIQIPIPDK